MNHNNFFKSRTAILSLFFVILLGISSDAYAVASNGNIKVNKVRYVNVPLLEGSVYLVPADSIPTTFWGTASYQTKIDTLKKCFQIAIKTSQPKDDDKAQYHKDGLAVTANSFQLQKNTKYSWYVIVFNATEIKENSLYYISETKNQEGNKISNNDEKKLPDLTFDLNGGTSNTQNWHSVTPLPEPTFTFTDSHNANGTWKWFDGTKPFTIKGTVSDYNVVDSISVGGHPATLDANGNWSYTYNNSSEGEVKITIESFKKPTVLSDTTYCLKVDNTAPTITDIIFNNAFQKNKDSVFFKKDATDAQVKATVSDNKSGIATLTFKGDIYTSGEYVNLSTSTIKKNTATFHAVDSVGHVKDSTITYFVDGTAPAITVADYTTTNVRKITLGLGSYSDLGSGIDSVYYVIAKDTTSYSVPFILDSNCVVKFVAIDHVGNKSEQQVNVTNIISEFNVLSTDKVDDKYEYVIATGTIENTDEFKIKGVPGVDPVTIKLDEIKEYNDKYYKLYIDNDTKLVLKVVNGEVITVEVGSTGYATVYYSNKKLIVPEGATATAYANPSSDKFLVSKVFVAGDVLPAGNGYVVVASPGSYDFVVTKKEPTATPENCLKGSDTEIETPNGNVYVLDVYNGEAGFYPYEKAKHSKLGAHKAYYQSNPK